MREATQTFINSLDLIYRNVAPELKQELGRLGDRIDNILKAFTTVDIEQVSVETVNTGGSIQVVFDVVFLKFLREAGLKKLLRAELYVYALDAKFAKEEEKGGSFLRCLLIERKQGMCLRVLLPLSQKCTKGLQPAILKNFVDAVSSTFMEGVKPVRESDMPIAPDEELKDLIIAGNTEENKGDAACESLDTKRFSL